MFKKGLLWILIAVVALLIFIGAFVSNFTYQRASALGDLRTQTDLTVRAMSKLSNASFSLLFDAEEIHTAQGNWNYDYLQASNLLDNLSTHPGLQYIDPSISVQIKQIREFWQLSTSLFVEGNRHLVNFHKFDLEDLALKNNINDMLIEIQKLDEKFKEGRAANDRSATPYTEPYYLLVQAFTAFDSANDHLWFFTVSGVEKLGEIINEETARVIRIVLIIAIGTAVALLLLIITAFIISQRILRHANIRLEKQVKERTQAIQNLLDYSEEGFLSFGPDFIINTEISKECNEIFGRSVVGEDFTELLFTDEQAINDFKEAFELIFSGVSLPEVVFEVIDSKVRIEEKILKLDFHLVNETQVMCQLSDITENELLQQELEAENAQREMILRVVTAKRDFISLIAEAENLFAALEGCISEGNYCADEDENDDVVRALHTFKANAAFLRMNKTVEQAHNLEASLIELGILSDSIPLGPEISNFKSSYEAEIQQITEILGQDWLKGANSVEVELHKLEETRDYVAETYPEDHKLQTKINSLASMQLTSLFNRLTDLTKQLARSNGKRIDVKTSIQNDILVTPNLYRILSDSINHILRNMVTHGIEFPRHREKAGKQPEGIISIDSVQQDGHIELKISDDGAGLSIAKIKEHAVRIGLVNPENNKLTNQDYIKLIFQPGFTTADTITAVSGRGYGLSAVRESIYEIGGRIKVSSSRGRGTRFTIIVPNKEKELV